jgi:serine/threonine protein kinase
MGIVWLAHDEYLHRDVAIKEIQPRGREIRDSDPEVRRTLREARAAAKLSEHPGIITVHDVVTDERGLPWIVMQLLSGRSLGETLDHGGPMPVNQAAAIAVQVLQALEYAHNNGVLHRDVKPGNVMLVGDKAVLTDFGIAVIDGASALTATGQIPGAPEYIAPERILGEEALPSADLWSVGITLYGMVVGRTPFHRTDIQATLAAALSQEPDSHPGVGRLWPVIQGLLRKKPAERWTARQAIDKLTEIAALPAPAPDATRVRLEYPTKDEDPAGAITVIDDTTPNTRTQPPPLPPLITRAAPDDPTLDPFPAPREPRLKHGLLTAAGIVFTVVVIVAAAILVSKWLGDQNPGGSPTTTQPVTTTRPPVALNTFTESDFRIGIPPDWQREPSSDGPVRYVAWKGKEDDPTVGTLNVRVLQDTSRPGVSALTYLTDEAKTQSESQDNIDFQPIGPDGDGESAVLEYTHGTAAGSTRFHTWVQAFSQGTTVYTLTFSLFAGDAQTLQHRWQDTQPLVAQIRDSFRPNR